MLGAVEMERRDPDYLAGRANRIYRGVISISKISLFNKGKDGEAISEMRMAVGKASMSALDMLVSDVSWAQPGSWGGGHHRAQG